MTAKERFKEILKNPTMQEFIRFCIVGVIATLIDVGVFYLVRQFAVYQVALVCGYVISLIVNYFLTTLWTFKKKPSAKNAVGIVAAHLLNLFVVRMSLMYLFVDVTGMDDRWAYLPTLLISMFTNFVVVRFVAKKW